MSAFSPLLRRPAVSVCLALVLALECVASLQGQWPQDHSDLKADSTIRFGALDNGLRYVVMPNSEPPGRASLRLYMNVGSLMEEDDQQGMAHFLEHMAFNGSRHFKPGEMVEYFQRLGMGFGADTNAHTSFKETVYMLELPKVEVSMLDESLQLFRDNLDGLSLGEAEINRERGIILSEKLSRDSIEYRTMLEGYRFAMPESLLPKRLPIGLESTLKSMGRERFVDFYRKWYTPRRAVVVAVGDFADPRLVEEKIRRHFADAKAALPESEDPSFGRLSLGRGRIAKLHHEPEAKAVDISLEILRNPRRESDGAASRRRRVVRDLADSMLNQRLSKLAKAEATPILGAEAYAYEYLEFVEVTGAMAQCAPQDWQRALTLLENEVRRAALHGFTAAEFREATASLLKAAQLRAAQAPTRKSRDLASGLVNTIAAKRVITHPADDLKRLESVLASLKVEECARAFSESWNSEDLQIFIGGKLRLEGDASAQILETYAKANAASLAAPAQETAAVFAYRDFGAAGKVVSRSVVEDLGITQLVLSNGVRVNLKRTEFEKGTLRVTIQFGSGKLEPGSERAGLIAYANACFIAGGLKAHDSDELRRLFADKTVGMDFQVGDEAFQLSGRSTPQDLTDQLQLLCSFLTAPGFRAEAHRQFQQSLEPMFTELEHTAEGVMANVVTRHLHGDDPRFGYGSLESMRSLSLTDLQQWMAEALASSYIEVSVVGDLEEKSCVEALLRTVGALAPRSASKADRSAARAMTFPKPGQKRFEFTTQIPKAVAALYWPTGDMSDIARTRRLILLAAVLDDRLRLKVREELGETYSPACYHVASDSFKGYGYLTAMVECKAEQASKLSALVRSIADELAQGSISEDEFERARKPLLSQLEQMRRDNRYWAQNVVRNCQEHPERLQWARSMVADVNGISRQQLQELARQYLGAARVRQVEVMPKSEAKPQK